MKLLELTHDVPGLHGSMGGAASNAAPAAAHASCGCASWSVADTSADAAQRRCCAARHPLLALDAPATTRARSGCCCGARHPLLAANGPAMTPARSDCRAAPQHACGAAFIAAAALAIGVVLS
jgi:hypothetical protein